MGRVIASLITERYLEDVMARAAVDELLYMMDEAFDPERGHDGQSLLPNLVTVSEEAWCERPAGGSRSIRDIVLHVGACKYVYDNYAFGDATLRFDSRLVDPWPGTEPHMAEVIEWLWGGHRRVRHHVAELEDEQLAAVRKASWGGEYPTRWLINVMIQHDLYHAGEINHIRSLLLRDDRWAWERELALS
jgi:uncharacterized damage-inducible protein DinB